MTGRTIAGPAAELAHLYRLAEDVVRCLPLRAPRGQHVGSAVLKETLKLLLLPSS